MNSEAIEFACRDIVIKVVGILIDGGIVVV